MQEKRKALRCKAFRIRNHPCFDKKVRNTGGVQLECVDKKDAGAKPCVARVCGLLRLDFPFCNSNPQHLVMTDE